MRARPVTFPQRPLEEGKSLEALQSVQDRFQGVSPRSDSKFRFRQVIKKTKKRGHVKVGVRRRLCVDLHSTSFAPVVLDTRCSELPGACGPTCECTTL